MCSWNEKNMLTKVIMPSIGDGAIYMDLAGKILYMRTVVEDIVGIKFEDACGKGLDTL